MPSPIFTLNRFLLFLKSGRGGDFVAAGVAPGGRAAGAK